jgi:TubC N-terminal docking domain
MDARKLLAELAARGIEVRVAGEELEIRPGGAVPAALLAELRAQKPEVLRCLAPARPAVAVADVLGGVVEASPSLLAGDACAMGLEDFARAGLVVEVWSEVLGEAVVLASDDACVDPGELRAVYRARELRVLLGLTGACELRRIHDVKKTFRGTITDASSHEAGN